MWGTQTELPGTKPGKFPNMVRAFEGLYRDGVVRVLPMTDEEVGQLGIFTMTHYTDQKEERTVIRVYLHLGTVMEAIEPASEPKLQEVLFRFAELVINVIGRYELLKLVGAKFSD